MNVIVIVSMRKCIDLIKSSEELYFYKFLRIGVCAKINDFVFKNDSASI